MKGFLSYQDLLEAEFHTVSEDSEFEQHPRRANVLHHQAKLHGHEVNVEFTHHGYDEKGHYGVDFHVGGHLNRNWSGTGQVSGVHKQHILHHIGGVVDKFVHEKKPKTLRMLAVGGSDEEEAKKHKLYGHFARMLASKHGALVHTEPGHAHEVHFMKNDHSRPGEWK